MTTNTKKTQEALRMALEAFEADASNENFLVLKHCVREALAHAPSEREQPARQQREDKKQWVGLTSEQWFSWWQVSTIMDNTEAEIDFADFLMIALAVQDVIEATLREKNNGTR